MDNIETEKIHWAQVVSDRWNLSGQYKILNSEFDFNFELIQSNDSKFIVKIMRLNCEKSFLDAQVSILEFLRKDGSELPIPKIIKSVSGKSYELAADLNNDERIIWVLEKIEGIMLSNVSPISKNLMLDLGKKVASLDLASKKFTTDIDPPSNKWDLTKPLWIRDNVPDISDPELELIINEILDDFLNISDRLNHLPHYWIHNDLNDQNLLVGFLSNGQAFLSGILDFGDLSKSPTICNVAICSAYLLILPGIGLNMQLEFLRGYHSINPISEEELDILFTLIITRLAVSYVNSSIMAKDKPDDPYVIISQKDSKNFLWNMVNGKNFFTARFRNICDLPPVKGGSEVIEYLNQGKAGFHPIIRKPLKDAKIISLDLESIIPIDPHSITQSEAINLTGRSESESQSSINLGKYLEPRLIYTAEDFRLGPEKNSDRRTIHLGIDVFAPFGTEIFTPLEGEVIHSEFCDKPLDYGGFVVIEHRTPNGISFFSLFGHLDPKSLRFHEGEHLGKGDLIGKIGSKSVNGGWEPHLHLQLALGLGQENNWPGVCNPDDIKFWSQYCPNPATLLGINPGAITFRKIDKNHLIQNRIKSFSGNLKLSYKDPILIMRGFKNYLFDESGRCYLDFYNNVPHVGHSHSRIANLVNKQLRLINSNTRYLHPSQKKLSENLLSKFPSSFEVVFFVNSGSEANELALRLAKTYTGNKDFVTFDHGYHGNTNAAIEVSPYKFNKPNGIGKQDWVHVIDCPNEFRDVDPRYQITKILNDIQAQGRSLGGFISETFPSVAGQIIPQPGILQHIYEEVKAAGGVCIADEVQTGLGRLGGYYFGFEQQKILPDIVVLGKPIGNGHPIGAVVTTQEIAKAFNNGIEFFSTFGGSDLSCLIANEVLEIVDDEMLGENSKQMGSFLEKGLVALKLGSSLIGDVRGMGLFWGVEIIRNFETKEPGTSEANYICNRLRDKRILVGLEGPYENILRIRPPLSLIHDDVKIFLSAFADVLEESYLREGS